MHHSIIRCAFKRVVFLFTWVDRMRHFIQNQCLGGSLICRRVVGSLQLGSAMFDHVSYNRWEVNQKLLLQRVVGELGKPYGNLPNALFH